MFHAWVWFEWSVHFPSTYHLLFRLILYVSIYCLCAVNISFAIIFLSSDLALQLYWLQASLLQETIKPRTNLPPLLAPVSERRQDKRSSTILESHWSCPLLILEKTWFQSILCWLLMLQLKHSSNTIVRIVRIRWLVSYHWWMMTFKTQEF